MGPSGEKNVAHCKFANFSHCATVYVEPLKTKTQTSVLEQIPERLEIFDEVDLIRKSINHHLKITDSLIQKGDFVRLLNKRGALEKEGQRFTCKIYLVEEVGLNSVKVQGKDNKINMSEALKVSQSSHEFDNSLRKKQLL